MNGTWVRGHSARGEGGYNRPRLLPGPDQLDDLPPETFGPTIDVDSDSVEPPSTPGPGPAPVLPGPGPDEPPGHAKREWRDRPRAGRSKAKPPPRVTAGVRQDITGQIGFLLQVPGEIWRARDPLCGGMFVNQLPDIADSLADWVVDSPSLLALFTGPGGSWVIKAVKTAAAFAPVASAVMAHHVYHTVETGDANEAPDYQQYAA